jgi:hypothetical protein
MGWYVITSRSHGGDLVRYSVASGNGYGMRYNILLVLYSVVSDDKHGMCYCVMRGSG